MSGMVEHSLLRDMAAIGGWRTAVAVRVGGKGGCHFFAFFWMVVMEDLG